MLVIDFAALWAVVWPKLQVLIIVVCLDVIFGVIKAVKEHTFTWENLADYLESDVVPILIWLAACLLGAIPQQYIPSGAVMVAETVIYATVFLKVLSSLLASFAALGVLTEFFGRIGVPVGNKKAG